MLYDMTHVRERRSRAPGTKAMRPDIDSSFVGRSRELDRCRAALSAAMDGQRQILLLSGEPGIGKTRCAEMFARVAEDCGALTLWGRCYEEPGAPPYWPWVQILREYLQSSSESELRAMTAARVQDIAAILPDLSSDTSERQPLEAGSSDHVRFRTFDAVAQFLASAARHLPLVLIIDNLHWADAPSLSLLEFLSQELVRSRVLIIVTYRDLEVPRHSPLTGTLGGLCSEAGVERIRLSGLPQAAIAELANHNMGVALPQRALNTIYQQTDGNPLFVLELLKVLQEESTDVGADAVVVRIPDGVRETIGRRLSHLPECCNELLAVASVAGRNFRATEIGTVAGRDFTLVLGSLDAAARAGLIERAGAAAADSYRFTHALIREVLYDELPAPERLRLHGRVADTLVQIHRGDLSSVLSTIAHHYSEAAPLGYGEQAVTFELWAAERAIQMCAYEDAVSHYDRALATLSAGALQDDERIVRACYLKGCACSLLGDTRMATEALLHGVKHAVRLRSPLVVDLIARLLWSTSDGPQSFLAPLLERTLSVLPEGDGVTRAKAIVSLASALRSTGSRDRIESLVTESISMAERLKDAATLCTCVKLAIMALRAQPQTLEQRLALATLYIKTARDAGDEEALSDAYSWQVLHLLEAGRLGELDRLLDDYRRMSVARFGLHLYYVRSAEVTLDLLRGRWQNAEANLEALLAIGSKMQRRADAEGVYSAQMFALNRDLGRLRALQPMVVQFVRNGAGNAWLPGLMLVCAELGMRDEARQALDRLAEQNFGTIPRDEMFVTCLVYCAETCCRLGDRGRAATLYSLLSPNAGSTANHPRAVCFGSTDLYLAMLAALCGETDRARVHFESALQVNRAMEAWPWLARTLFRYGLFLRGLDSSADTSRARSMLADAEQLAAQLGMAALVGEIGSAQTSESGAYPDQLTAREVEVLRLLAIGRTNKDISIVLTISLNTVATHVRSILEKTGSANRTEAAAYAIRMGLRETS